MLEPAPYGATGVHGFHGTSSMERLPTEQAITTQIRAFTNVALGE